MDSHTAQSSVDENMNAPQERVITSLRQLKGRDFHEDYILEDVIGEGAMGVVFRAVQKGLGRHVALKLMKGDVLKNQEEIIERFRSEIQIVSNLSHPNIIRFFDSGYEPRFGLYYVSMELIEGLCLGDLLRTHRCHPALAMEIAYQICCGLTEPHRLGVVHRDLKPDNIFLRLQSDGALEVKILDFGIACALHNNSRITRTGMLMGTPAYMAPELATQAPINTGTDLYALGIMLFEMLTGDVPHQDETPLKVLMRHITAPVAKLASIDPELDLPGIQNLLDHLLQKEAQHRPASAFDVSNAINAIREDAGLVLRKFNPLATIEAAIEPLVTLSKQTRENLHRIQSGQLVHPPNHTEILFPDVDLPPGPASLAEESSISEVVESIEVFEDDQSLTHTGAVQAPALSVEKKSKVPLIALLLLFTGVGLAALALNFDRLTGSPQELSNTAASLVPLPASSDTPGESLPKKTSDATDGATMDVEATAAAQAKTAGAKKKSAKRRRVKQRKVSKKRRAAIRAKKRQAKVKAAKAAKLAEMAEIPASEIPTKKAEPEAPKEEAPKESDKKLKKGLKWLKSDW